MQTPITSHGVLDWFLGSSSPAWLLLTLLAVVVSIAVGTVTLLQLVNASMAKKHALYERRWAVYIAMRDALSYHLDRPITTNRNLEGSMRVQSLHAKWLFPRSVHLYCLDVERAWDDVAHAQAYGGEMKVGETLALKHAEEVLGKLDAVFSPWLELSGDPVEPILHTGLQVLRRATGSRV